MCRSPFIRDLEDFSVWTEAKGYSRQCSRDHLFRLRDSPEQFDSAMPGATYTVPHLQLAFGTRLMRKPFRGADCARAININDLLEICRGPPFVLIAGRVSGPPHDQSLTYVDQDRKGGHVGARGRFIESSTESESPGFTLEFPAFCA